MYVDFHQPTPPTKQKKLGWFGGYPLVDGKSTFFLVDISDSAFQQEGNRVCRGKLGGQFLQPALAVRAWMFMLVTFLRILPGGSFAIKQPPFGGKRGKIVWVTFSLRIQHAQRDSVRKNSPIHQLGGWCLVNWY